MRDLELLINSRYPEPNVVQVIGNVIHGTC